MRPFSLLVKPVGDRCNLDCNYCFFKGHGGGVMERRVFGKLLESYLALPFAEKSIALQGGEPLLSPEYVFDMMESAPLASRSVQTNGTLLTKSFARRFRRSGWLVGVSLDGDAAANRQRVTNDGKESFAAAERGIRELEAEGVEYNILTVVTHLNAARPAETYRFLRRSFLTRYHQYIECTGPRPADALTGAEWGGFLCGLFDEWIKRDVHEVSIGLFDSIVSHLVRGFPTRCASARHCAHYFAVDWDGSVYPCDFHMKSGLKLGNAATDSWEAMLSSSAYRDFAGAKLDGLDSRCRDCRYFEFCNGDCPRSRTAGRPMLCEGWKMFFAHALPVFRQLVESNF